jgi:putative transposase
VQGLNARSGNSIERRGSGAGLESAIAAVWDSVPVQRCTVHKHRNLLAHAPERLHDEITEDYNEMIYAKTPEEIERHRKAFIRKWRLKHEAVANSLEEAGDQLFTSMAGKLCHKTHRSAI